VKKEGEKSWLCGPTRAEKKSVRDYNKKKKKKSGERL